eukprot:356232-Chlamydomonas_euryale.AAC.9
MRVELESGNKQRLGVPAAMEKVCSVGQDGKVIIMAAVAAAPPAELRRACDSPCAPSPSCPCFSERCFSGSSLRWHAAAGRLDTLTPCQCRRGARTRGVGVRPPPRPRGPPGHGRGHGRRGHHGRPRAGHSRM